MQKQEEKRRCSILKKRRSRSLSPKSPAERTTRRASRRISFSGKHNVREFFGNENTAIVWGETYDVSAEKHASSNEQITLQSTRMSSMSTTLQITRNESISMDITSTNMVESPQVSNLTPKPATSTRSSILRRVQTFGEDQKENIPIKSDDSDIELSLMMQPPLAQAPSKPAEPRISSASSYKIGLFDFAQKKGARDSVNIAERTSGSDNMEISSIGPSLQNDRQQTAQTTSTGENTYRNWLHQNKFIPSEKDSRRQTVNEPMAIQLDDSNQMIDSPIISKTNNVALNPTQNDKRKTINEPSEMSLEKENKNKSEQSVEENSIDMSIEVLASELKHRPIRRRTTHQPQDISLEKPSVPVNMHQQDIKSHQMQDMSFDTIHWSASPQIEHHGHSNWKMSTQSANRRTINEPHEMSFDSTGKTNVQLNEKTILADISMDLQSTKPNSNVSRKSVICKSPCKNATAVFGNSEEIELTKGIDESLLYSSYHPLHSTKLNDINNTKFTEIDFDESGLIDKVENNTLPMESSVVESPIEKFPATQARKSVQMVNQTKNQTILGHFNLDISEDSPLSTAKKYNLNKTPFYFGMDKENDPALIETMHASDSSSLDLTNQSREMMEQTPEKEELPSSKPSEVRRGTVMYHTTIGNDTDLGQAVNETNTSVIEISSQSDESIGPVADAPASCSMDMDVDALPQIESKRPNTTIMTQSILNLTPIQMDDSVPKQLPLKTDVNHRLTVTLFDSASAMNESPVSFKNLTSSPEETKQLTFIEDDDEDDQICNTKLDLAGSLEFSEINDLEVRKHASNNNCNLSRLSLHSGYSIQTEASISALKNDQMEELKDASFTNESPKMCPPNFEELNAFRKSRRLRHSNVFDGHTTEDNNRSESIAHTDEAPKNSISLAQISRSSIMQRRSNSIGANDTSYLLKEATDIPLSEIKLDFSGYDKLVGLATPNDVLKDFCSRMDQIRRKAKKWEDDRKKLANGEIESLDLLNNNDEDLVSQNVEAPSWTFLYRNKLKCEEEQIQAEIDREWEQRPVGAFLPAIPDISMLILNKCRMLKNWIFDDIWFFQGNIHLRNKLSPFYKVCFIYDPSATDQSVDTCGALKFKKINQQYCPVHLKERTYPVFRLEVQELKSKLPKNLLSMCETSANLCEFDDKLNGFCERAHKKVDELHSICRKTKALIKEENGLIYIIKTMLDLKSYSYQDYIIELSDIDSTEWRNVRTNPRRVLNDSIKSLPKGMPFIKELLTNDAKYIPYIPWQ